MDGFSGEFKNGRRNSQDWASGEIPKSGGGISSTPSMRGTVCYIAPEYGGDGQSSEKCDVYSFGVLLVVVSGRRPLQVTASPMSEFERANPISWARQLAYNGKLLDLVDTSVHSLEKDQALLCITIGLLCLQKSPSKRPTLKEIVGMLSGEAEPPHLPFEFSPHRRPIFHLNPEERLVKRANVGPIHFVCKMIIAVLVSALCILSDLDKLESLDLQGFVLGVSVSIVFPLKCQSAC
ncbi:hypothetical protein SADUNF_Sadunf02G0125900 [Salix dunnii]|uniref:Protein kinase domain-containing protein n=1 Tax=Salix dunnii TaxID=1413687 RepID=A0A835N7V7_9ROSI|nr:hypothetical protein SADUNF_Sadunf02G0125900 [Salix dunnii]